MMGSSCVIGKLTVVMVMALMLLFPNVGVAFSAESGLSRSELLKRIGLGAGGIAYAKLVGDTLAKVSRGNAYPEEHERRVRSTIEETLSESIKKGSNTLNVLEVGIGSQWRVMQRGLYDQAITKLNQDGVTAMHLTGVDIKPPDDKVIQQVTDYTVSRCGQLKLNLEAQAGDITSIASLPFAPGSFDAIICCLTLCSVSDPETALFNLKHLLKPAGGCLGFIEHVAVNDDETNYKVLEWQQRTFDPLQQIVADNCHLHRYTENSINSVFGVAENEAIRISGERFLVEGMWPVSCQVCGVIKRVT